MGQFSESLTVRILGESEGLQRALEEATRSLEDFQERLAELSDSTHQLGEALDGVGASQGLERVSNLLERIRGQMLWIIQTPLTINVAPAMASLGALSAMLDMILAKLMMIRAMGTGGGGVTGGNGGGGGGAPVGAEFATGGPVTGPPGLDRVPAMLTAGEFVISAPTARELGQGFLWALNENPGQALERDRNRSVRKMMSSNSSALGSRQRESQRSTEMHRQDITHVGGVTIHVHGGVDPESALRHLRLQGISQRNRRG